MSISLTINASDANDLRRQLSELLGSASVTLTASGVGASGGGKSAPKTGAVNNDPKPKVEETKGADEPTPAVEPEPETDPEPETEAAQEDAGDAPTYTYEDHIKPSVLKVSAKHGRPGVEKLLTQFGVANAREVPEEKWPEFMAEIEKLLG